MRWIWDEIDGAITSLNPYIDGWAHHLGQLDYLVVFGLDEPRWISARDLILNNPTLFAACSTQHGRNA